ncbi:MAG: hypothetical protein IPH43_02710 [Xanthomonadales bacterium]|nr:hypothetical protein [Xanthomonadales bacterium]
MAKPSASGKATRRGHGARRSEGKCEERGQQNTAAAESTITPGHREKRRNSAAGTSQRKAVAVTKSRAASGKKTAASGSFAASIARFARKSKALPALSVSARKQGEHGEG